MAAQSEKPSSEVQGLKKIVARDRILPQITRLLCEINTDVVKCLCTRCWDGDLCSSNYFGMSPSRHLNEDDTDCKLFKWLQEQCAKHELAVPTAVDNPISWDPDYCETVNLDVVFKMGVYLLTPCIGGKIQFAIHGDIVQVDCKEERWLERIEKLTYEEDRKSVV